MRNKRIISVILAILFAILVLNSALSQKKANTYENIIVLANDYFNAQDYLNAKASYQYALQLKPEDPYAEKRLKECLDLLKNQSGQRNKYAVHIIEADKYFNMQDFTKATAQYKKALEVFAGEEYPQQQLQEIERLVREKEQLMQDYSEAVSNGDAFMDAGQYNDAKIEYQFALSLLPEQHYPIKKIQEIENILSGQAAKQELYNRRITKADSLLQLKMYNPAKQNYEQALFLYPEEEYPKQKLAEIKPLLENIRQFELLISEADKLYLLKNFEPAKAKYKAASDIFPDKAYPKEMLEKIMLALSTMNIDNNDEAYQQSILLADKYFDAKNYSDALSSYQLAAKLKPDEKYPKEKLAELQILISRDKEDKNIQNKYEQLIEEGDLWFAAREYEKAGRSFLEASLLLTDESYAREKIKEINTILQEISAQQKALENYTKIVAQADSQLQQQAYEEAKLAYRQALAIFPDKKYPQEQIKEITRILEEREALRTAEENYAEAVKLADGYFANKQYPDAEKEYRNALTFKGTEKYPQSKLQEIEHIYARQKIEVQEAYQQAIATADSLAAKKNYTEALLFFRKAANIIPEEDYPSKKISEIEAVLATEQKMLREKYAKIIEEADRHYGSKMFDRALQSYTLAGELMPDASYPQEKCKEIRDLFHANTLVVLADSAISLMPDSVHQFSFEPLAVSFRKSSYVFLKLRNTGEAKNQSIILNYGKGQVKNGGMVVRLSELDKETDYLVRIGVQYKWFSEDNNWLSLQAQGAAVELSLIKISRVK